MSIYIRFWDHSITVLIQDSPIQVLVFVRIPWQYFCLYSPICPVTLLLKLNFLLGIVIIWENLCHSVVQVEAQTVDASPKKWQCCLPTNWEASQQHGGNTRIHLERQSRFWANFFGWTPNHWKKQAQMPMRKAPRLLATIWRSEVTHMPGQGLWWFF